jgi:cellulose synthase/poly-beta-1,6-N-acetylglucosamine synthase-like glycosyltransferase
MLWQHDPALRSRGAVDAPTGSGQHLRVPQRPADPVRRDAGPAAAGQHIADNDISPAGRGGVARLLWTTILKRAGLTDAEAGAIVARARTNGVAVPIEAVVSGAVEEERLYRELARVLGLGFLPRVDPQRLILGDRDGAMLLGRGQGIVPVKYEQPGGLVGFLVAPAHDDIEALRRRVEASAAMRHRVSIVAPGALRDALVRSASPSLLQNALDKLFTMLPVQSAKIVTNGWQGVLLGAILVGLPAAILSAPSAAGLFIHLFFSLFFLACVGLRFVAVAGAGAPNVARLKEYDPAELPVYSVLVALYREAEMVPDLLVALGQLVWPRGKLEIKLVCEADDEATLAALRAHKLQSFVEIVEVPPSVPRTKPKALCYALPMTSGEFVVVYDAEDRPHPFQLIEAWQRFSEGDSWLACLQAPLVIMNFRRGPIARMFAFEYAALFRGLLPWLARRGLFIPLGGTSTHFRREALDAVGAWDPYNVTEDADLGLRLARHGYQVGMITRPTYEDAPEKLKNWLPQRTRWFKGWIQTWLVHMRHPARLWRDLGPGSFAIAQILCAGMVVSSIAHLVFLGSLGYALLVFAWHETVAPLQSAILIVDAANIVLGYLTFLLLGRRTLLAKESLSFWKTVLLTPVYWVLMSLAALRALWKLYREPHHWEKTDHPRRVREAYRHAGLGRSAGASRRNVQGIPGLRQ